MSAFDKISKSIAPLKRKLFDYQISLSGNECQIILLKVKMDKYKDREIEGIVKSFLTSVIIDIPGEVPITRLRTDVTIAPAQTKNLFFYDILPIQVYTKFEDNIERDDILIQRITMDNNFYYMVLQITETVGNIVGGQITYKKQNASPFTMALPSMVKQITDSFKE